MKLFWARLPCINRTSNVFTLPENSFVYVCQYIFASKIYIYIDWLTILLQNTSTSCWHFLFQQFKYVCMHAVYALNIHELLSTFEEVVVVFFCYFFTFVTQPKSRSWFKHENWNQHDIFHYPHQQIKNRIFYFVHFFLHFYTQENIV